MDHVQIQFSIDDVKAADAIIESLLMEHLVACGQRTGPFVSRYWWDGVLEQTTEWLVLLKTRAELAPTVVDSVVQRHPYELPEVITLAIAGGSPGYLSWIESATA